ncbi:protein twisted gastrulation-like [Anopheles albimanus]|uniref:protein twisted gastrulation-like n=1 Tax=Anopheles albimanus TaxID=7167 RepID=UPI00163E7E0E|nr:protein twisted gastrulation-like [Anopheles albimanus]XP_035795852.1 protein twisted gastrulation-like [Anopheles albimanus]
MVYRGQRTALRKTLALQLTAICVLVGLAVPPVDGCNEMVCASIVSKCMLTQSCKCDMKSCTCCKECAECLSYLYTECCSCLEMCPKPNETSNELSKQSHIEDLEGFPGLYDVITSEQDAQGRWKVFSFPIDIDAALYGPKGDTKYLVHSTDMDLKAKYSDPNKITVNCTVAYQAQCMSWNKCKESCRTMGASSYRWFHDGCCECVGHYCINYGVNESRCRDCPESKEHDIDDFFNEDELDYGDSVGPMDNSAVESTNI